MGCTIGVEDCVPLSPPVKPKSPVDIPEKVKKFWEEGESGLSHLIIHEPRIEAIESPCLNRVVLRRRPLEDILRDVRTTIPWACIHPRLVTPEGGWIDPPQSDFLVPDADVDWLEIQKLTIDNPILREWFDYLKLLHELTAFVSSLPKIINKPYNVFEIYDATNLVLKTIAETNRRCTHFSLHSSWKIPLRHATEVSKILLVDIKKVVYNSHEIHHQ